MTARLVLFTRSGVEDAAAVVKAAGLVVYPTDTVYGLGVDPMDSDAVRRLFAVKRREARPIPILCDSLESALRLVWLNSRSVDLAKRHWPGALTIVAPLKEELPFQVHQGSGTVGVRVPASKLCAQLIRLCGGYLTGTSANISGRPPCRSAGEAMKELGGAVDLILDGGCLEGKASTVVRVLGEGIEVLRKGPVGVNDEVKTR
ncbi:MAG: threonylcarbamoyl-AMP synthase [Nitrososphaerales archaeon]|nr:threonylcarbamoyl-AMP synthase [Nitrososphaerales archaeon]